MPLLDLDAALQRIGEVTTPINAHESCALDNSLGRVLAEQVIASAPLPAFDNSAVDGYALRHADASSGRTLRIIGHALAGYPYLFPVTAGTAVRIATGAMVPTGADTIVMQENCNEKSGVLTLPSQPLAGNAIRKSGADFKQGDIALAAGRRLQPHDMAVLGALGCTEIFVLRKTRIAIISTGTELRPADAILTEGQIADTNGLMLKQLLSRFAVEIDLLPALPDNYEATLAMLTQAATTHDLIITSGGVSVGSHDFIRDVVHKVGHVHFWRLAIRPGKPVLYGKINKCLLTCLPGNPVSAMVTFLLITSPVLNALNGLPVQLPPAFTVPLGTALSKESQLRDFPRARLEIHCGTWKAFPIRSQSSNLIGTVSGADGLLDLPVGETSFAENTLVAFRPFYGLFT
jgi:molybdopterin molybdotransferase